MSNQKRLIDDPASENRKYHNHLFSFTPLYALRLEIIGDFEYEERIQVRSPEDVATIFINYYKDKPREEFFILLLDTANTVTGIVQMSTGGLAASIVEPRAVFAAAISANAAAIVAVHNHPSQNIEPSREDIRITRQLVEAGKLMGIPVRDHLIIGGAKYTSLAERGLLG